MRATNVLPQNMHLICSFKLDMKDKKIFWGFNLGGLFLFIFFGWLFVYYMLLLRPGLNLLGPHDALLNTSNNELMDYFLSVLGGLVVFMVLHELTHGAFFWLFTRHLPVFGFRGTYTFAGAPGWYLPRSQHLIVGSSPLVVLTILGMILLAVMPIGLLAALLVGMLSNISGAVGDIWVAILEIRECKALVVEDSGDSFNFYAPN